MVATRSTFTVVLVGIAAVLATTFAPAAQAAQPPSPLPVVGTVVAATRFTAALAAAGADPQAAPVGVNVAGCRPAAAHPYPVVLVNGTFTVMQDSFGYLGPRLAAAGYCVFGYNYGAKHDRDLVQAVGSVPDGVTALRREVGYVLATTSAARVDLVGYSQGGLITELYTKFGGAPHVHSVTAIAPPTHGTTLLGIGLLGKAIPGALPALRAAGCPACADQVVGSAVVRKLNAGPVAVAGIPYTVIDTVTEDVVTPAGSSFIREPGVVNEYVQQFDALNLDEHVVLPFDTTTANRVLAALQRAKTGTGRAGS